MTVLLMHNYFYWKVKHLKLGPETGALLGIPCSILKHKTRIIILQRNLIEQAASWLLKIILQKHTNISIYKIIKTESTYQSYKNDKLDGLGLETKWSN